MPTSLGQEGEYLIQTNGVQELKNDPEIKIKNLQKLAIEILQTD